MGDPIQKQLVGWGIMTEPDETRIQWHHTHRVTPGSAGTMSMRSVQVVSAAGSHEMCTVLLYTCQVEFCLYHSMSFPHFAAGQWHKIQNQRRKSSVCVQTSVARAHCLMTIAMGYVHVVTVGSVMQPESDINKTVSHMWFHFCKYTTAGYCSLDLGYLITLVGHRLNDKAEDFVIPPLVPTNYVPQILYFLRTPAPEFRIINPTQFFNQ